MALIGISQNGGFLVIGCFGFRAKLKSSNATHDVFCGRSSIAARAGVRAYGHRHHKAQAAADALEIACCPSVNSVSVSLRHSRRLRCKESKTFGVGETL